MRNLSLITKLIKKMSIIKKIYLLLNKEFLIKIEDLSYTLNFFHKNI
jgi:hypothetical protein